MRLGLGRIAPDPLTGQQAGLGLSLIHILMANIDVGFVADSGATLNILLPQGYKNQTIVALGGAYLSLIHI